VAVPAGADDRGRAKVLMSQADSALDEGGCFRADRSQTGCESRTTFQEAAARYDQAVALDPSLETAMAACAVHKKSQGPDFEWSLSSGAFWVALARCDHVAFHPDTGDDLRRRARSVGSDMRSYLRFSRKAAENDARRAAAAKALYGAGLTMKFDKQANQISLAYGSLDAKTLQGYIGEYYAAHAPKIFGSSAPPVTLRDDARKASYLAGLEKGVTSWILLEPMAKFALCKLIADTMDQGGRDVEHWCQVQQAIEANAPLYAFTGAAVKYDASVLKDAGLTDDQRVFLPTLDGVYPVAITIAGPHTIDDYQHINFLKAVAATVNGSNPQQAEVLGMVARADKLAKEREAKWAKADAKLGGTAGKVVFAEATFQSWDVPAILAAGGTTDCAKLHYKAWAPKGSKEYDAAFAVDGTTCNVISVWSNQQTNAVTESLMLPAVAKDDNCPDALKVPGEHQVTISMHEVKAAKTGNRVIKAHGSGLKIEDEYMGVWGKKVGSWSAKCTTAGSGATSRFQ
jgi:hypothetical protein